MKLPSGKDVSVRRPTYGEIRDARLAFQSGTKDDFYMFLYPRLTTLTLDEVNALDGADGLALEAAVDATLLPRREEEERPFETASSPTS